MITYHPFGTRGYKNLQLWDQSAPPQELRITEIYLSQVLMNDQEPIYIDAMKSWKQEQYEMAQQRPYQHYGTPTYQIGLLNAHTLPHQEIFNPALLNMLSPGDIPMYEARARDIKDPIAYYNDRLDDISWIARLMFTSVRTPIIVHSELRSPAVESLTKEFISVYVFWHGLIARDWYRNYRHHAQCIPNKSRATANKRFLLYARDYTGSRSYREHFVKQLITNHLAPAFQYQNYPEEACLHEHFSAPPENKYYQYQDYLNEIYHEHEPIKTQHSYVANSDSSAIIHVNDYNSTAIQIVAETVFENQRIHLTEKTFQPMVAGQPFVTLSAPGTLEILKYYGFQTFDHVWDESYDKINDPAERMSAVIDVIKYLNTHDKFEELYEKCMPVCEHNRQHFFSTRFESQMLSEYDHNWRSAFELQNDIADIDPGGSQFWFINENLTKLNFELVDWEKKYLKWQLKNIQKYSKEQHQGILKQYPWCSDL